MKDLLLLITLITLFTSCEKRTCSCQDDMRIVWKDGIEPQNAYILIPNAVENTDQSFQMAIRKIDLNQEVNWTLDYVKVYQGNAVFADTDETEPFIKNNTTVWVSHEIFQFDVIGFVRGPVSFEFHLTFPDDNTEAVVEGTVFYYDFEDLRDGFDATECRWPCQVVENNGFGHGC